MVNEVEDVIIIGAGPAGIAAAIQLKRCGISALLLEGEEAGGLLKNANLVENYPGFPQGIPGTGLVDLFIQQMQRLSISPTKALVDGVSYVDELFVVNTDNKTYHARRLVAASGTKPAALTGVDISSGSIARIYYEVYPLINLQGKEIAIIGAGDAAFDYALNLSMHNQVYILNRTNMIKSLPLLVERTEMNPNVRYSKNTRVRGISEGDDGRLMVKCKQDEGIREFSVDYVIAAIGRVPNIGFLCEQIKERMDVFLSRGLLYLIGDVKNDIYRQTSIAVGDGVKAAMEIYQREEGKL